MFSYLLLRDNKQSGPYNFNELRSIGIKETDLLWIEGRSTFWQSPKEIDELLPFLMPYASSSVNIESKYGRGKIVPKTESTRSVSSSENTPQENTGKITGRTKWNKEDRTVPHDIGTVRKRELLKSLHPEDNDKKRPDHSSPSSEKDTAGQQGLSPVTVFIADDHTLYREGVKIALASHTNIRIIGEALNGAQLLNMLQERRPDVILLDIEMPVMDGITALKKIRTLYPTQKVIMLSMHEDRSMVATLMEAGANAYLSKTDDTETICKAIKTCSERDYFFTDRTNLAMLEELKTKKRTREKRVHNEFDGKDLMLKLKASQKKRERDKAIQDALHSAMFWVLGSIVVISCGYALIYYSDDLQRAYDRWLGGKPAESFSSKREYYFFPPFIDHTTAEFPLSESVSGGIEPAHQASGIISNDPTPVKQYPATPAVKKGSPVVASGLQTEYTASGEKEILPAPQTRSETIPVPEPEKQVPAARVNLNSQIQASVNDYKVGALGGIFDIEVSVKNSSPYKVDEVVVEVDYYLSSDKVFKTELLTFTGLAPESTATKAAPKSSRGVRVEHKIRSILSRESGW